MAYTATNHSRRTRSVFAPVRGLVSDLFAALERHHTFVQTYRALSRMSDRELDDIGISRGDINDIALGLAERR